MEITPILTLDKRISTNEQSDLLKNLSNLDSYKILYVLDLYGINKDKPNLYVYQKLSRDFDLWIDSGPRNLGDVVDNFLAGATAITIREKYWPNVDVSRIREISENKIYLNLDTNALENLDYYDVDGLVNFKTGEEVERDFKLGSLIKQTVLKKQTFCYEKDIKNITYWKSLGIDKFLVDIDKIGDFEKYGF